MLEYRNLEISIKAFCPNDLNSVPYCWLIEQLYNCVLVSSVPDCNTQLFIDGYCQWEFQDPKLEVPTIYKVYVRGLCKGISPENMALYGTNVPPF